MINCSFQLACFRTLNTNQKKKRKKEKNPIRRNIAVPFFPNSILSNTIDNFIDKLKYYRQLSSSEKFGMESNLQITNPTIGHFASCESSFIISLSIRGSFPPRARKSAWNRLIRPISPHCLLNRSWEVWIGRNFLDEGRITTLPCRESSNSRVPEDWPTISDLSRERFSKICTAILTWRFNFFKRCVLLLFMCNDSFFSSMLKVRTRGIMCVMLSF